MYIFGIHYYSAYERNAYQNAKEEYEEVCVKIEKLRIKGRKQYETVTGMLESERKFIGYKAIRNYRADNNAGNTLIGNAVFFFDEDLTAVRYFMKVSEYNHIKESIRGFYEMMEEENE